MLPYTVIKSKGRSAPWKHTLEGWWDMYDPEGYSLEFCVYKYNNENMVSSVTLNKVSGFSQRMDLARKYAFGKILVIGSKPPYKIKGLWLFRGEEISQFVLDECYDMELNESTKVGISDEAQKEHVNAMIEDLEPFEGTAIRERGVRVAADTHRQGGTRACHASVFNMEDFDAGGTRAESG